MSEMGGDGNKRRASGKDRARSEWQLFVKAMAAEKTLGMKTLEADLSPPEQ